MCPNPRAIFGFAFILWFASTPFSAGAEPPASLPAKGTEEFYRAKLGTITIPRLQWKQVPPREVFDTWARLVRENDPTKEGIPVSLRTVVEGTVSFSEGAWDVPVEDLLGHICLTLHLQYGVSNEGIYITSSKHPFTLHPSPKLSPEITKTFVVPDRLIHDAKERGKGIPGLNKGWWRDEVVRSATIRVPEDVISSLEWLTDGKSIRVKADPQALDDIAASLSWKTIEDPPTLNAGEERLLAELEAWERILLPAVVIDAPTLRQAVDKVLAVVQSSPGGENVRVEWKFLNERLAEVGPVHFEHPFLKRGAGLPTPKPIPASHIVAEVIGQFGGTLRGNPDGSWGIDGNRLGEGTGMFIAEYKVPPQVFEPASPAPAKSEPQKDATAKDMIICNGVTFPYGTFATYSRASGNLLVKNTILGHLGVRKALSEKWPKPEPAKPKKTQKKGRQ
jgi:hypothetical protein